MARRPTRVRGFNYRGCHQYFVTTCTYRRTPYFVEPEYATELALRIPCMFAEHSFDVPAYCVMPDHVHFLLEGRSDDADFRKAVRIWTLRTGYAWRTKHETALWQIGYWERVLREGDDIRAVVRYLLANPVRAGLVTRFDDYEWSGSARFTLAELAEHAADWTPPWRTKA